MKVNNKRSASEAPNQDLIVALTQKMIELQKSNRNVFIFQADDLIFFYRALGRSEYKNIQDQDISSYEKEDLVCKTCLLYPEDFNFDNCDAGIPTVLTNDILKNSFLDSIESRKNVLQYYRQDMFDLDQQITCIINEAFPNVDIEEIEAWDVEKTTKYLTRAEWKLQNLRGIPFNDIAEAYDQAYGSQETNDVEQEELADTEVVAPEKTIRGGDKDKKMTPEKLRELQAKYPEIDWGGDTISNEGISGMEDFVDVVAPALRPGF